MGARVIDIGTGEPPDWAMEQMDDAAYMASGGVSEVDAASMADPKPTTILDLEALSRTPIPEFQWFVPGWLSPHPTLMSGRGGIGKSLAALQMAVALAAGKQFLGAAVPPLRVLLWSCEEDRSEMHRRLSRICHYYGVDMASLKNRLIIDCRHGCDNTLLSQAFGVPQFTGLSTYLREQVGDYQADVFIGDNIAHMYACNENERHPVTMFTSWLSSLGAGRVFCPLLIGHVAKGTGSEYSGSTAWENAVRMRWYLGDRLPDEPTQDEDEPGNLRFLCKRKTNYDQKDYLRFIVQDGLLIPEQVEAGATGLMAQVRMRKARDTVIAAIRKLADMGIYGSEKGGPNYLPKLMTQYSLTDGISPKECIHAVRDLMVDGTIQRDVVGRDNARRAKEGLVIV